MSESAAVVDSAIDRATPLFPHPNTSPRVIASPSVLGNAHFIMDIRRMRYPEGYKRPQAWLNKNALPGKYRYDRDFLLQFMSICTAKPDSLPALDTLGLTARAIPPRGSHGRRSSSAVTPAFPQATDAPTSDGVGVTPSESKQRRSSEAQLSPPAPISGEPACIPFGRPSRTIIKSTVDIPSHSRGGRTRAQWGRGGRVTISIEAGLSSPVSSAGRTSSLPANHECESQRMLSVGRLLEASTAKDGESLHTNPRDGTLRALLDELMTGPFDPISDQIITHVNRRSEHSKDGGTLPAVVALVYDRAMQEHWTSSATYARLCRKMMEQISPSVRDADIRDAQGKPIAGGQLFRKYLLSRCKEDFERAWGATAHASEAVGKNELPLKTAEVEESSPYDDGRTAQEAGRHNVNVVAFMGELFMLQMLTERIIHNGIITLLTKEENLNLGAIECLCTLLIIVGRTLDTPKARAHMQVYFSRLEELRQSSSIGRRERVMMQDVIVLRAHGWVARANGYTWDG
ncbi:ARM repeat-containing protein [Lentinus brumalis]|uniref:ARM repeat-containing protein n=1 Tax=Lentinus brumalis TaxID=2498619 RepID=A0A371D9Y1_9APHY|nr:ARM repeat-containing protein [Polyporus brumalis]